MIIFRAHGVRRGLFFVYASRCNLSMGGVYDPFISIMGLLSQNPSPMPLCGARANLLRKRMASFDVELATTYGTTLESIYCTQAVT
jgi:hypothetical protein